MNQPLISICIPAYRKPEYVARCLESISMQDYKNVEVIISDDSPDEDIKAVMERFTNRLPVQYYHNKPALRSPANWNNALDKGKGDYLLLLHQDDWFHVPTALSQFVSALENPEIDFVFCRNTAIDESGKETVLQALPGLLHTMAQKPNHLLRAQVIGPPSNTMLRRSVTVRYDEQFIWLVDVDYYSRLLKEGYRYHYLDQHLVSIGLHSDQTTEFCRANNDIIIKENILFAAKLKSGDFHDILIFDYYWRLLRNSGIRSIEDLLANRVDAHIVPKVILHMIRSQKKIAPGLLKKGPLSKAAMSLSYTSWRLQDNN
ncbi:MAG TPA: glycosyltransferase family 2 protein [Flavisolibacter sp.]|jgi:glycosyltransferase involved in cell wall biosynthesis|nr:glycosyltransferase family 2 protein [Flavisolibacter sp.]